MEKMVCAHIFYKGIVQGVGFRYTVQRVANTLPGVKGWVKNLSDGRVEILVEGPTEEIDLLLERVDDRFCGSIQDKDLKYEEVYNFFESFKIIF